METRRCPCLQLLLSGCLTLLAITSIQYSYTPLCIAWFWSIALVSIGIYSQYGTYDHLLHFFAVRLDFVCRLYPLLNHLPSNKDYACPMGMAHHHISAWLLFPSRICQRDSRRAFPLPDGPRSTWNSRNLRRNHSDRRVR